MMMNQRRILVAVLGFFFIVGVFMGVGRYFHMHRGPDGDWTNHIFGGKITHLSATDISVSDIHGTQKTFVLTPQTEIRRGKDTVTTDALSVGSFVVINIAPAPEGKEAAREVRLLSTSPRSDQWRTSIP